MFKQPLHGIARLLQGDVAPTRDETPRVGGGIASPLRDVVLQAQQEDEAVPHRLHRGKNIPGQLVMLPNHRVDEAGIVESTQPPNNVRDLLPFAILLERGDGPSLQ